MVAYAPNASTKGPVSDKGTEAPCGISSHGPSAWQQFATLPVFTCTFSSCVVFWAALNVYLSSQIPSLEKEFNISSTTSGTLISAQEYGYFTTLLFVSYFGKRTHIPRLLSLFSVAMGLIAFVPVICELMSLPSLPKSDLASNNSSSSLPKANQYLCVPVSSGLGNGENAAGGRPPAQAESPRMWMVYVLGFTSLAMGIAKTAEFPLPVHYIDNNVQDVSRTGVLAGILLTAVVLGTPVSLAVGTLTSSIPVDLSDTTLAPEDPRWIGAWWLGFVIMGLACPILGIPVFFFPRQFHKQMTKDQTGNSKEHEIATDTLDKTEKFSPESLSICLSSPSLADWEGETLKVPEKEDGTQHLLHSQGQKQSDKMHEPQNHENLEKSDGMQEERNPEGQREADERQEERNPYGQREADERKEERNPDGQREADERQEEQNPESQREVVERQEERNPEGQREADERQGQWNAVKQEKADGTHEQRHPGDQTQAAETQGQQTTENQREVDNTHDQQNPDNHGKGAETQESQMFEDERKGDRAPKQNQPRPKDPKTLQEKNQSPGLWHEAVPASQKSEQDMSMREFIENLPLSVVRVLKVPVVVLLLVALGLLGILIGALRAFIPKYVALQFNMPQWRANFYLGITLGIPAVLGSFGGGLLCTRLNLDKRRALKFAAGFSIISTLLQTPNLFFGCQNQDVVGFSSTPDSDSGCVCDSTKVLLSCGQDGRSYLSPCMAGCTNVTRSVYGGCGGLEGGGTVTPGLCDVSCDYLVPFLVTSMLASLCSLMGAIPYSIVLLRSVEDTDKSMVLALVNFSKSVAGMLPGPIIFGKIVDWACVVWADGETGSGSCLLYDIEQLRYTFFGGILGIKALYTVLIITALLYTVCTEKCTEGEMKAKYNDTIIQPPGPVSMTESEITLGSLKNGQS